MLKLQGGKMIAKNVAFQKCENFFANLKSLLFCSYFSIPLFGVVSDIIAFAVFGFSVDNMDSSRMCFRCMGSPENERS